MALAGGGSSPIYLFMDHKNLEYLKFTRCLNRHQAHLEDMTLTISQETRSGSSSEGYPPTPHL